LLGLQQQCIFRNDLDLGFCFHLVDLSSSLKANFSALPQELWVKNGLSALPGTCHLATKPIRTSKFY
jgi:hypothetical protein